MKASSAVAVLVAVIGALAIRAPAAGAQEPTSLTVASWGGAYGQSQERAFIKPFEDEFGIKVSLVNHKGALDKLRRDDGTKPPAWDVVDLSAADVEKACREGLLETIDPDDLAAAGNGTPARNDFLKGGLHDCGVSSVAWSSAIVFDRGAFEKRQPENAADFFDPEKFPGRRALPKGPKYTFELALLADGVAPGDVYRQLDTDSGVMRALTVLDRIKSDIVWWERAHEPLQRLAEGEVTLAVAFNGRIFYSVVRESRPFGIIWDGQIYDLDMWAVPKGTPNRDAAMRFIAFSTRPDRLAEQVRWFPYGPMRKSAIARIGKHAEANVEMRDFVPTAKANFKRALQLDGMWWARNEERLKQRFQQWLDAAADLATENDGEDDPAMRPESRKTEENKG